MDAKVGAIVHIAAYLFAARGQAHLLGSQVPLLDGASTENTPPLGASSFTPARP